MALASSPVVGAPGSPQPARRDSRPGATRRPPPGGLSFWHDAHDPQCTQFPRPPRAGLGPRFAALRTPFVFRARRRATPDTPRQPLLQKYYALPNFGFVACVVHPGPARGALRDRHEMRAGVRWTRQRRRGDAVTGTDNPLSHARRGRHGDCHSGLVDRRRCAHRAPARRPRRPRTEKSCGPDARQAGVKPSGDAAARPGTCIIEPQGDGGNSASLPEESTKDTVKTSRAGKAGRPARPVVHPVCIRVHTDSGASRRPAFPAPSGSFEGARRQHNSGETRRGTTKVCLR